MSRLWIVTIEESAIRPRPAIHPGEVLADELAEINTAPGELARQIAIPTIQLSQIIKGKRPITGEIALRLGHWFGTNPQFWLNLQTSYDLRIAERAIGDIVKKLPKRSSRKAA